jgi:hypothetical protein
MVIGDADWIIKLGPITRTNHAGNRVQAEEGAVLQVKDDVKVIMDTARPLIPLLSKGVILAGGAEPVVKEEVPVPEVVSYELPDGKWFSIATSKVFGVKLVEPKPREE